MFADADCLYFMLQGATVRCRDYCGWTPLHEAANHGYCGEYSLLRWRIFVLVQTMIG